MSGANVRLLVAYDGSDFRGLAPNQGVRTVVGELQRVIEPLIGRTPDIVMSGRTDAGVHAWGQVLSFRLDDDAVDLQRIQRSVNARLGPEVVLREISLRRRRLQCPLLGHRAALPVPHRQSGGPGPVPGQDRLVGADPARPRRDEPGLPPPGRRARFQLVLSTAETIVEHLRRRRRDLAGPPDHRSPLARPRRRCPPVRDRGLGVLPPDGSQHRRVPGGRRSGQARRR